MIGGSEEKSQGGPVNSGDTTAAGRATGTSASSTTSHGDGQAEERGKRVLQDMRASVRLASGTTINMVVNPCQSLWRWGSIRNEDVS